MRRRRQTIAIYKVEPYVVAADVYAVAPHIGRGGWTWYTGSAGWMYRLIVESLLGLRLEVDAKARGCISPPACPRTGRGTSCATAAARPTTRSTSRRLGSAAAVEVHLDGVLQGGALGCRSSTTQHGARVVVRCLAPADGCVQAPQRLGHQAAGGDAAG